VGPCPIQPHRGPSRLDPDSPDDCAALSAALYAQTGVEIDLGAVADAMRVWDAR
jgi:hypothetical protein